SLPARSPILITCSFATTSAATRTPPSATDDGSWRLPTSSPLTVVRHRWRPRRPSSRSCSRTRVRLVGHIAGVGQLLSGDQRPRSRRAEVSPHVTSLDPACPAHLSQTTPPTRGQN